MNDRETDPIISEMTKQVADICRPFQIFLVSRKNDSKGSLTAFKLCIIVDDCYDTHKLESKLLMETDCDVPCDFIVYTAEEWNEFAEDDCSFAYRIDNSGVLLYGER